MEGAKGKERLHSERQGPGSPRSRPTWGKTSTLLASEAAQAPGLGPASARRAAARPTAPQPARLSLGGGVGAKHACLPAARAAAGRAPAGSARASAPPSTALRQPALPAPQPRLAPPGTPARRRRRTTPERTGRPPPEPETATRRRRRPALRRTAARPPHRNGCPPGNRRRRFSSRPLPQARARRKADAAEPGATPPLPASARRTGRGTPLGRPPASPDRHRERRLRSDGHGPGQGRPRGPGTGQPPADTPSSGGAAAVRARGCAAPFPGG